MDRRNHRTVISALAALLLGAGLPVVVTGCSTRAASSDLGSGPSPGAVAATERPPLVVGEPRREPWEFEGIRGRLITTEHFRLHTTLRSADMLERLPGFYEACLDRYTSVFGPLPPPERPLEAFIFRDSRQWQAKTREIIPDRADAFMNLGRGGLTTLGTSVLYYIGPRDTFAIAAHEGWHQYTQSTFRDPLPIWLEEGIATYMEAIEPGDDGVGPLRPGRNHERLTALSRATGHGRLIPLEELLAKTPQSFLTSGKNQLLVYYAQVWALTRFLAEGEGGRYRPALEELLADAAAGRVAGRVVGPQTKVARRRGMLLQVKSGPLLLQEYFNRDREAITEEYERYVRVLARGRDAADTEG